MSDSESDTDRAAVEESLFDDYGRSFGKHGPQASSSNFDERSLVKSSSEDSEDNGSKVSGVGDLPESTNYDSVKRQMSIKFRDLMTDMSADEDEVR